MKLEDIPGDHTMQASIAGNATPNAPDEFTIGILPFAAKVTGAWFIPTAAVTGAATNHMTVAVCNRLSGAGSAVVALKEFVDGVNAVAFDDTPLTLTENLVCAKGDVLTLEKLVVGTGMPLPDGHVVVTFQAR